MKKGITISILVITVVLMFTIVTTATVIGTRAIQTASYEEFLSKLSRVTNDVNKYVIDNGSLPTTSEIIAKEGLTNELKEELNRNNDASNNLFVIDMTKLRTESVNIGKGTIEDMDVFIVAENTNNIYYLKGVEYRGTIYHGIPIETIIDTSNNIPEEWATNVVAIVDGVPIPKGFVASSATGENAKNNGLVIYEGTEEVTIFNVETAKRTRNQYVWVPVEDFTKFVRQDFGLNKKISNILGKDDWESELDETTNMPLATPSYMTFMSEETLAEVQEMYASVREYGGFYIGRYEAGIDNLRNSNDGVVETAYTMMGKVPYVNVPWSNSTDMNIDTGGAVEAARNIYKKNNSNYGAVSTLTYSVQWDSILQWWLDLGAIESVTNSEGYGNYSDSIIENKDLNDGSKVFDYSNSTDYVAKDSIALSYPKSEENLWCLSTGALKSSRINNIYDMAGNVYEWSMEGNQTSLRYARGGAFDKKSNEQAIAFRGVLGGPNQSSRKLGFRLALYMKIS